MRIRIVINKRNDIIRKNKKVLYLNGEENLIEILGIDKDSIEKIVA